MGVVPGNPSLVPLELVQRAVWVVQPIQQNLWIQKGDTKDQDLRLKAKGFKIQGIEIEEEPIWSELIWSVHLAHFCFLCPHQYHQPEHLLLSICGFNCIRWQSENVKSLSSKEDATDITSSSPSPRSRSPTSLLCRQPCGGRHQSRFSSDCNIFKLLIKLLA